LQAQEKNDEGITETPPVIETDSLIVEAKEPMDALSPARAAFYSAILPGLGQAYNKRYWKIPIVYGALGTGIYFFVTNQKEYNRYRDAYKSRLAGFKNDEFYFDAAGNPLATPRITTQNLQRAQELFRKNKDLSLLITAGIYALNIIDANVDAHLLQYNVDENLTLAPHYKFNEVDATSNLGLTLNLKF
tara:strand:+ start:21114 stop:21680 length:567 start_codon:yes stop_codon:yes gene_type:complete